MSKKHQVIIIQKGHDLPDGLRQSLQTKGFATQVVSSNDEATSHIGSSASVVVVYCSDEVDLGNTVKELNAYTALHDHPLIIVGANVDEYESALNQHFLLATTIRTPCSTADILAAIEYVIRYIEKNKPVRQSDEVDGEFQAVHGLYKQFSSIPNLVFDQIIKLGVLKKDIGGNEYATTFRPDRAAEKPFMPENVSIRKTIMNVSGSLSDMKAARYYRIAELSNLLFKAIGIGGETLETAKAASFLYSSSYIIEHKDLVMKEYLSERNASLRKELCSRIKDSAINAGADFSSQSLSTMIATVARFIGEEGAPGDDIQDLAASCIAAADFIDRLVYIQGVFQPVAAYCVLAKLKTTPMTQIHPLVLACLIKLLAEAVTTDASALSKSKKLRNMAELMKAADEIKDAVLNPEENSVPLASLAPGMKLSRPLNTFDGKEVLNHDMILDQDLIWRLWQLAAIRPLGGPVVVFTDS